MYSVYLLLSEKDLGYYIGYTSNIRMRIPEHQNGKVASTKHRRPLQFVYCENYADENLARNRERKLKQFGSAYVGLLKRLGLR